MQKALLKHGGAKSHRCALVLESLLVVTRNPAKKVHEHARIQYDESRKPPRCTAEYPHALMSQSAPPQTALHHSFVQPTQCHVHRKLDSNTVVV